MQEVIHAAKKPRLLDLFCCQGGAAMGLGLLAAGVGIVIGAWEWVVK